MSDGIQPVRPGDLITAELMNGLLGKLMALETRVALLETGDQTGQIGVGPLTIDDLKPTGPYRVGQELTILGTNFGFSVGAHQVLLGSTPVAQFKPAPRSNDKRLVFDIPPVPGLAEIGTPVVLSVSNFDHTVTRIITLRPIQLSQTGNVDLDWLRVEPTTLTPGQAARFIYEIRSRAVLTADCTISVDVIPETAESQMSIRKVGGAELPGNRITVESSQKVEFEVQFVEVPGGANNMTLTCSIDAPDVEGATRITTVPIGSPVEGPDTSFKLNIDANAISPPGSYDTTNATLSLTPGIFAKIPLLAEFDPAAPEDQNDLRIYDVNLDVPAASDNWTVILASPSPDNTARTHSTIQVPRGGAARPIEFRIRAEANAVEASATLHVKRRGATGERSVRVILKRIS